MSNQSHLALVAEIRENPDEAEEKRLETQAASGRQDHDRPQPPTHPEAVMSIRELLDEAETRHAELEVQYWRTRELLDDLVRVALRGVHGRRPGTPERGPIGIRVDKDQRLAGRSQVPLAAGGPVPAPVERIQQSFGLTRAPRVAS